MAFRAIDDDDFIEAWRAREVFWREDAHVIHGWEADPKKIYHCLECLGPVKVRRGKFRAPYFYHASPKPSCRLYSKSEDHLLIQLELQKMIGSSEAQIEKPVQAVNRIADVLWETEKIVFEVQCSSLFDPQAEARIREYKKALYDVVWILDDRIFNKRNLRAAEEFLRCQPCYFASVGRTRPTLFYDQHEVVIDRKRVRKGNSIKIDFRQAKRLSQPEWPESLPSHIARRIPHCTRYFAGDLIDKSLRAAKNPKLLLSLEYWKKEEEEWKKRLKKPGWLLRFYRTCIRDPYIALLDELLRRTL